MSGKVESPVLTPGNCIYVGNGDALGIASRTIGRPVQKEPGMRGLTIAAIIIKEARMTIGRCMGASSGSMKPA